MRRDRLPYLILPVAALLAVLPLILHGASCGHDFDFHILSWLEAARQFRHGNLHPQWAFSPAWNAGEPRFVFYPPLSWTVGALLGLILPWSVTPIVYTWLALTASGLAMHRLARAHAGPTAALLASTLYLANPYMLFTAYERTAYAELLAAAWLPLLLHAILKPRPTIPAIAVSLALLWLTNAPAAVMGTYALALLAAIRLILSLSSSRHSTTGNVASKPASLRQQPASAPLTPPAFALSTVAGTLLGLALAAFYIVPAAIERPLVQIAMVILPGMRIEDNTLFHHTGTSDDALAHDAVLHTASILAILLLAATAAALLLTRLRSTQPASSSHRTPSPAPTTLPLAVLTAVIALLLTPVSLPLWHHLPELAFLQFPWRLLAILAAALGLAAALALNPLQLKPIPRTAAALALVLTLTAAEAPPFRQSCDPEDTVSARLAVFLQHSGSEPTDEYTPAPADNDSLHPGNPPFWLSPDPDAPPPANLPPRPAPQDLTIDSLRPQTLILNLREYPAWHIRLNGREIPTLAESPRADGLLTLSIPPGQDHIHLAYRATPIEHAADALSLASLLGLFLIAARPARLATVAQRRS